MTPFEIGALTLTALAAANAARALVWFAYAAAILLPAALRLTKPRARLRSEELTVGTVAAMSVVAAVVVLVHGIWSPPKAIASEPRRPALETIGQILRADPNARVFASYDLADWLLFRLPQTRGRIAFDGRWEILPPGQMETVIGFFADAPPASTSPSSGYRLIVLSPQNESSAVARYAHLPGTRILYRDARLAVFDRGRSADR